MNWCGSFYNRGWILPLVCSVLFVAGCGKQEATVVTEGLKAPAGEWQTLQGDARRSGITDQGRVKGSYALAWTFTPDRNTNGFVDWGAVLRDGVLFTPDGSNRIVALNAANGKMKWERGLSSNTFAVALVPDEPILLATTAITTRPSPTLYALNPENGRILWENTREDQTAIGGIEGPPVVEDGRIFAGYLTYNGKGGVVSYDLEGQLLWHQSFPGITPLSPLTSDGENLYVGLNDKQVYAISKEDGSVLWTYGPMESLPTAAPVATPLGIVVGARRELALVSPRNGQAMWTFTTKGDLGSASPAFHDGVLYAVTRESRVHALELRTGKELWQTNVGDGSLESSPVLDVKSGTLVFGSNLNRVVLLDSRTGEVLDRIEVPDAASGHWKNSPVVVDGWIFIGSSDKSYYAFKSVSDVASP